MIYFGRGAQTIRWVPMDDLGHPRVVSVTYSIVDLREAELSDRRVLQASAAATASTVSTTITAAAGPDTATPRRLVLTDVTGVRLGGVYLLADADNATEEAVTVAKINTSGLEVETTRPLTRSFPSTSTFVGLEVEGTFPAADADDELRLDDGGGPFQVTWVYTIGSQLYVAPQALWLTRYGMAPWVTFDQCAKHLPGLAQHVGDAVDPTEAISAATDDLFERLLGCGTVRRDPAFFRGNLSADLFVRKRAVSYMLLGSRSTESKELAIDYRDEAEGHVHNLTEGTSGQRTTSVHPTEDVSPPGTDRRPASRLFVRP